MTELELMKLRELQLELEANGVMAAISRWEQSSNSLLRSETIMSLSVQARILMARAEGIREYLDREKEHD
jgi:hypothetical protein